MLGVCTLVTVLCDPHIILRSGTLSLRLKYTVKDFKHNMWKNKTAIVNIAKGKRRR